jgi:hypothetical protein
VDAKQFTGSDERDDLTQPDPCSVCGQTAIICACATSCQRCLEDGDVTPATRDFDGEKVCEDCYCFLDNYEPRVEADL